MKFFKNQRGDTIMEVLICVAVLSFVLSTAFALANRSSQANQQAGERGESMNLSESQVEKLKAFISQSATPAIPGDGNFCLYEDQGDPADTTDNKLTTVNVPTPNDLNSYPTDCKDGEFFNTYVNKTGNTYTVHTKWNAITGNGEDDATMVYRVYPDIASTQTGVTTLLACNAPTEFMNSFGGCEPCAPGYQNLLGGFSMAPCSAVPPTITVRVQKILSPNGTNSPTCSNSQTLASGVGVRLETFATQLNDNSTATFNGLMFSTSYTASIPTIPANFVSCPPATKSQTTLGQGSYPASNHTIDLVIRAECYNTTVFDSWHWHPNYVDRGSWHEHGHWVGWWSHVGPGGYWGRAPWYYPNNHQQVEADGNTYLYAWPSSPPGVDPDWRNRYRWDTGWVHDGWHWHPWIVDEGSWHAHYRNVVSCPS